MRIGTNPLRKKSILPAYRRHRIIVPVYIPGHEGYFKDALAIFRLSLDSLLATVDEANTSITIIDNASVPEVEAMVAPALADGRIDRYVRHAVNRGKPDPVAGELKACYEPFVTIADCDVLFLPGWQRRTEEVFHAFPAAGAVSPSPAPHLLKYASASTWLYALLSLSLRRRPMAEASDLDQFEHSIGKQVFDPQMRRAQFLLDAGGQGDALVGCGHFVVTLRQSCYQSFRYAPGLGGTGIGEQDIDRRIDQCGMARLSTPRAHVKHLGNTLEEWMEPMARQVQSAPCVPCLDPEPPGPGIGAKLLAWVPYRLRYLCGMGVYVIATTLVRLMERRVS